MENLLDVKDLAGYLKLNRVSVLKLLQDGEIKAAKIMGKWRIRENDAIAYMDRLIQEQQPQQETEAQD